jgi:hypothetical protein
VTLDEIKAKTTAKFKSGLKLKTGAK